MLEQCQGNPHTTPSHDALEKKYHQDLTVKRPVSWGKMNGEHWSILHSAVEAQFHPCKSSKTPRGHNL